MPVIQKIRIATKKKDKYHSNSNCWKCDSWKHDKNTCDSKNPECNQGGNVPFHVSAKGKAWMSKERFGPFVHAYVTLDGKPIDGNRHNQQTHRSETCEYTQLLLKSITNHDMIVTNMKNDNETSDFLTVNIFLSNV
jgi:hypothetical protein